MCYFVFKLFFMSKHTSSFRKIGQSGPTIDGRTIEPQWLLDIADTYNLATYTAMIWPDHMRYLGNYGTVEAVRAETDTSGTVSLFAQITPNSGYLWENAWSQKLFFSMEIEPDFAKTGKAYLVGLAVTDNPASLGTEATRFGRKAKPDNLFIGNVAYEADTPEEAAPGWFTRYFDKFLAKNTTPTTEEEQKPMDKQQYDALCAAIGALSTKVDHFTAQLDAKAQAETSKNTAQADTTTQKATAADPQLVELCAKMDGMAKSLGDIAQRFEAAQKGTKTPETTGAAGDEALL